MAVQLDQFKCGICFSSFQSLVKFLEHKILHNQQELFTCLLCETEFQFTKTEAIEHLRQIHSVNKCSLNEISKESKAENIVSAIKNNKVYETDTSANFALEGDDERNENTTHVSSCNKICTTSNPTTNIINENHQTSQSTFESPSVITQGILNLLQDSTLHQPLIQNNTNNSTTHCTVESTAHRKVVTADKLAVIKTEMCVTECEVKENCDSFFCGSKLLTENEFSGNFYAENYPHVTERLIDGNSLSPNPQNKCIYTTENHVHPIQEPETSFSLVKDLISTSILTDKQDVSQSDLSFNMQEIKTVGQTPLPCASALLGSSGSATTFLVPLPLDLSATRNFCEALNLSITSQNCLSQAPEGQDPTVPSAVIGSEPGTMHYKVIDNDYAKTKLNSQEDSIKGPIEVKNNNPNSQASFLIIGSNNLFLNQPLSKVKQPTSKPTLSATLTTEEEAELSSVDFYFLLGNMNIKGNSLTYDRTEFKCLHCSFSTAWRPSLVKHMKNIHKDILEFHSFLEIRNIEPTNNCNLSSDDRKSKEFRVMKMSQYLAGNQKQKSPKRRIRKLERQDIPGKYHCPVCHKMFSRLRYMRRHQSTHRTERTHLCDNCGKSFKTKAILVAHRRSHKSKSYHCPQCNFISSSSAAIHIHRQLHPNGSVICEVCGNAYIDKSTLNKHMKVHDCNRPFPCTHPGCTWRFKTDVMRKAHVRSHTTVGKFSCSTCGYNFRQKHHLQRHIAKIHNGYQLKNGLSTNSLLSSSVLNLTAPSGMTDFSTQNLSVAHEILLSTSTETDLLKSSSDSHNSLMAPGVINTQSDVFSPSTSQLLCSITNTPFQTNLEDPEHAMIEVLVGDKSDSINSQAPGEGKMMNHELSTGNLSNLEYITETGQVLQLVRPGQTYMSRDEHGNLVQYKIADVEDQDESSHPIYLIGVDGTVVGAANSQEQALIVNTDI